MKWTAKLDFGLNMPTSSIHYLKWIVSKKKIPPYLQFVCFSIIIVHLKTNTPSLPEIFQICRMRTVIMTTVHNALTSCLIHTGAMQGKIMSCQAR